MATGREPTLLMQFARLPRPGRVKTRLQAAMSADEACAVHEALLRWTCRSLLDARLGPVELWVDGDGSHPAIDACLAEGALGPRQQRGDGLGARMHFALATALARYPRALLVGSDCPGLDPHYLQRARNALDRSDCVIGPAVDGGYVLIGARRISAACFEGVAWGSARACEQTVRQLEAAGFSWEALPLRRDIDRPEDLEYWRALCAGTGFTPPPA